MHIRLVLLPHCWVLALLLYYCCFIRFTLESVSEARVDKIVRFKQLDQYKVPSESFNVAWGSTSSGLSGNAGTSTL